MLFDTTFAGLSEEELIILLVTHTMSLMKKLFRRGPKNQRNTSLTKDKSVSPERRQDSGLCDISKEPLLQKDDDCKLSSSSDESLPKYAPLDIGKDSSKPASECKKPNSSSSSSTSLSKYDAVLGLSTSLSSTNSSDQGIQEKYRTTRRTWKSKLLKYRKKEVYLKRKQEEIISMQNETREIMRLLHISEMQSIALDEDIGKRKAEMELLCNVVTPEMEEDIRRQEPLCYKRYKSLKTTKDTKHLIDMIKNRQKALVNLEILTLKKNISVSHKQKSKNYTVDSQPLNKDRKNFDEFFRTIREQIVLELSEKLQGAEGKNTGKLTTDTDNATVTARTIDKTSVVQTTV